VDVFLKQIGRIKNFNRSLSKVFFLKILGIIVYKLFSSKEK
jgi:hypothetical protein